MLIYFLGPILLLNVYLFPALRSCWTIAIDLFFFSLAEEINYEVRFKDKTWSRDLANPDSLLYRKCEDEIQEMVIINVAVDCF